MARRVWVLLCLSILVVAAPPAQAGDVYTPEPSSRERAAIMDAVRAAVGPELRRPVKFLVQTLNVLEDWAFMIATPQQPDGRPFDYTGTVYEEQIREGAFDDALDALIHYHDGRWTVVAVVIGATDVAWEPWSARYNAPQAIFYR